MTGERIMHTHAPAITVRHVEAQPASGPDRPAMPEHYVTELDGQPLCRIPASALAPLLAEAEARGAREANDRVERTEAERDYWAGEYDDVSSRYDAACAERDSLARWKAEARPAAAAFLDLARRVVQESALGRFLPDVLAEHVDRQAAALREVAALHPRGETWYPSGDGLASEPEGYIADGCQACREPWPCATAAAVARAEQAGDDR